MTSDTDMCGPQEDGAREKPGGRATVLLVEDDGPGADILAIALRYHRIQVMRRPE